MTSGVEHYKLFKFGHLLIPFYYQFKALCKISRTHILKANLVCHILLGLKFEQLVLAHSDKFFVVTHNF
jgi:hypothetical protein